MHYIVTLDPDWEPTSTDSLGSFSTQSAAIEWLQTRHETGALRSASYVFEVTSIPVSVIKSQRIVTVEEVE